MSEPSAAAWLEQEGLAYIPVAADRPTGFGVRTWAEPDRAILQCAYIRDAVQHFEPDVLIGHQLTIGPYVMGEVMAIPLAVIGLAAWMYPNRQGAGPWVYRNESRWRHGEIVARLNAVRERLTLPPLDPGAEETPLQGDLFLLRSLPVLEGNIEDLPSRVHAIGAAVEPLSQSQPDLEEWLVEIESDACLYVQEGRTFDSPRFLDIVVEAFSGTATRVVMDIANMDGAIPQMWPENFFVRPKICSSVVLPRCGAVITTGHSTAVLSAILHGVPLLLLPNGSGTTDIAARCLAAGIGVVAETDSLTVACLKRDVVALTTAPSYAIAAESMQREFAAVDSLTLAADLLERLGSTKLPVSRQR
ncbi:nucleotide disphospho-sugar-binding domain-containing protein [Streptosporangium sp. NPDC049644]|uniref:glycosyltransferase n=1 Tax=Streptosporangium sp. NPDC049644 TaxID=3155507 RepID=UPI003414A814